MSSLIGRTLGQYKIVSLLGKGGMATVYLGHQPSIGRDVAIKVLPPHPSLNEQFIQRFELEARTIGGLQHPHILALYDYGTEDDILYLVMQYADGGTLDDITRNKTPDVRLIERVLRESTSALDYAHRRGIVHRDIKPANILLDGEGHTFLADFGIVKMVSDGANLTGTNIVGTPAYMAPEQGQGLEIDGRADIYSLGCMIFELLTGKQPYKADSPMQIILKHMNDTIPDICEVRPDLPATLSPIFKKVMAKDPMERYQTAVEFAEAFSTALHQDDISLASIRAELPLDSSTHPVTPVTTSAPGFAQNPPVTYTNPPGTNPPGTNPSQQIPQTVIMRDSTNPLILIGGFGILAVLIVAGAIIIGSLLLNQQNRGDDPNSTTSTAIANNDNSTTAPTSIAVAPPEVDTTPSFGSLRYSTTNNTGDTIRLDLEGVDSLADDTQYAAWLMNTQTDETLALGRVTVDGFGEGVLLYTDEDERILPAYFNAVIITIEEEIGDAPGETVVYHGYIPIDVSESIRKILVTDEENGLNGGSLLDGALTETRIATQHAGLAARASTIGGVRTHSEHTLNILKGESEDYNGDGLGSNPGRGVGLYFFLDAIETSVNEAISDEYINIQVNAEYIRVCAINARAWADRIVSLELLMLAAEDVADIEQEAAESTELAAQITTGFDQNVNNNIEPFEGECGLNQIPDYGIVFGNLTLREGDLETTVNGES